jgi:hypothetical protein
MSPAAGQHAAGPWRGDADCKAQAERVEDVMNYRTDSIYATACQRIMAT